MRLAIIAFLLLLCHSSSQSQGLATLYVYADWHTEANSWRPIFCDSALVAKLKRGTFFAINLPAGQHVLSDGKGVPAVLELTAAKPEYVSLDWVYHVGQSPTPILRIVKQEPAQIAMKYLAYIDPNKVLSPSVPKTDPRPAPELRLKSRPAAER